MVVGAAVLTITGLAYLAQTSSVANTGYDIAALQAQREQWQRRNDQLRLEIARAQSFAQVEREARVRLKMGPPERVVYAPNPMPAHIGPPDSPDVAGRERLASLRAAAVGVVDSVARAFGD
jgi:hypothetical protein